MTNCDLAGSSTDDHLIVSKSVTAAAPSMTAPLAGVCKSTGLIFTSKNWPSAKRPLRRLDLPSTALALACNS